MNDCALTIRPLIYSSHNPLKAMIDACGLFAKASSIFDGISCYIPSVTPAILSFMETEFFLIIFLIQSLFIQYRTTRNMCPLKSLVLSTFSRWFEGIMVIMFSPWASHSGLDLARQLVIYKLRNVCYVYVSISLSEIVAD